jgi:hypothetical protein
MVGHQDHTLHMIGLGTLYFLILLKMASFEVIMVWVNKQFQKICNLIIFRNCIYQTKDVCHIIFK